MGHPACQNADSLHLLGMLKLVFQGQPLGDVLADNQVFTGFQTDRYEIDYFFTAIFTDDVKDPGALFSRVMGLQVIHPVCDDLFSVLRIRIGQPEPGSSVGNIRKVIAEDLRELGIGISESSGFINR